MNNAIIQKQEDWVNTIIESAIVWLPIVAPLLNAVLVGNELLTQVLPMDSLIVKVIVTVLAAIVLEFSGMMFISFIAKAENYNLTRHDKAPGISVWWGWLAVAAYLLMSFFMYYFSTIAPALARYLGHSTSAKELAPISVVFFLPIIFFVFKLHRDASVMKTVQTAVDSLRRANVDRRRAEIELAQAEIDLDRQRAEVEMQRAKAEAVKLNAETKKLAVTPLVNELSTLQQLDSQPARNNPVAKAKFREILAANPTASLRKLVDLMVAEKFTISPQTVNSWKKECQDVN